MLYRSSGASENRIELKKYNSKLNLKGGFSFLLSSFCHQGVIKKTTKKWLEIATFQYKLDATRFELATSASRTQRSTKLSHASLFNSA